MMQVEAVLQMLQPGFSVAAIGAKRRNKSNPWFRRRTLFRSAVDVLRRTESPMTARQIFDALIADKAPQGQPQAGHRPAGRYPAPLRKRNGGMVIGEGTPARWMLAPL
jgi:hypothetical protein